MADEAANPHETAVANIENMFREREGLPVQEKSRPRNPDGTFAPEGRMEEKAQPVEADPQGTEQAETTEGQEPAQGAAPQSEEVDVEFDLGDEKKTYRIPKEISDRFIQHADYTRKTQDIAELRRVTSAEREAINLERAFTQHTQPERQQMAILEAQIDQYKNVNWAAIEDTAQLIRLREQLNQLKDQRATVEGTIKAKRGEFDERIKGVTQEALSAGLKYVQQHIKGYDQKSEKALQDYALSSGFAREEVARVIDPRIIVMLWKASQWDGLQSSKAGVLNKAQQAAPVVRPGATQRQVSSVQRLDKAFKDAKPGKDKAAAAEEYFAHRLGGR